MATPNVPTDDNPARASDSLQASYFRGALADHRALIAAEIARHTHALDSPSTRSDALTVSRLRREIRINEAECRDLDRMIEAIDRRFASAWAGRP